ncbi:primase-helicase family protein [Hymenobacter sp. PAMC 26628]|uniref:primase-helicase family protein n=1 Tax=Hymenobacter sp. PAMC 26628 TaxID=1484118 RepID=UPI00076FEE2D|nr:primase-helicase family protein [Hymenobacter sp. PAMC 26628]AMJ65027.1 hypothetical protein AXW84_06000 [Hymenobacter sp. PAMC 26628]
MPSAATDTAPPAPPAAISYAEQRLAAAGVPAGLLQFSAPNPRSPDQHMKQSFSVMYGDADDNLVIIYPTLSGEVETYDNGTKNNPDSIFERVRLKVPRTYTDLEGHQQTQKYAQTKGTRPRPFWMPGMVAKFQAAEVVPVLYLVEGELKAAAAFARGLAVVGMPSNAVVSDKHNDVRVLEGSLTAFLRTCKVETIVLLHDADALTVKWAPDKDLALRPSSFAQAVIGFREMLQPLLDDEACALKRAFYLHGKRELCEKNAKGLDDLFQAFPDQQQAILDDLALHTEATKYFAGRNITTPHYDLVRNYFGVGRVLNAETVFYKLYADYIGHREFVYRGRCYYPDGDEVSYVKHQDAARFARIGSDWYKWIYQPNGIGGMREVLENFKVGEIQRDYKKFPNFLDECPKYDGFTVEPNFNGEYQRVVKNNLNLITPLPWELKEGPFPNTAAFLKHIFGGEGTLETGVTADTFTVALDWLTIAHNHPKHQLPVVILVSKENKTGKSTFLKWMTWIYGSNATILNQSQFQMKFNNHYASKFFIGLDEAMQNSDKSTEKDRLKHMVTSDEIMIERKGVDLKPVPFYAKLAFTSNDAEKVMKIDEEDTRWFVVKVPPLGTEDADMQAKLIAEIPAWLHFLHHRKPHHERVSRLWFRPEDFITEQFHIVREATKTRLDRSIEHFIKDMFLTYRLEQFRLPIKWLTKQLNEEGKYRTDELEVRTYLKEKRAMDPHPVPMRNRIPIGLDMDRLDKLGRPDVVYLTESTSRPYLFKVQDWLSGEQLAEFGLIPEPVEDDGNEEKLPF